MELHHPYYQLPAEWFPQSGIQLTWPHEQTDWKPWLKEINTTFTELASTIARKEKVLVVSPHIEEVKALLSTKLEPQWQNQVLYYRCDTNDTWARDHAFITLTPKSADRLSARENLLLDFHFNGWGEKFPADKDNAINESLFRQGFFSGKMENHEDFVLEGGSIESDGKGTIFTTRSCLMAPHRNQPLTEKEIENQLKTSLHAFRVVWLNHGHLEGDDTDGHIDTIVRTAPEDTLLYVGCQDREDPQYEDLKALEKQLFTLKTLNGHPYRLMKLPMPDAICDENGKRLPATYANFIIANGMVICPTYDQPEKDTQAEAILAKAFPDREIVGIDARTVIRQHGSLHCLTMQYPKGVINTERVDNPPCKSEEL